MHLVTTPSTVRTLILTTLTLVAFAANSLLTRMALGDGAIDAASFMTLRLGSGALFLWILEQFRKPPQAGGGQSYPTKWTAALMLFLYAVTFSFSYLQLTAGTGALILFGTVQVTMITAALYQGETPRSLEWVGLLLALAGLIYLVSPGLTAPPLVGAVLMVAAGMAWGVYSLLGRSSRDPVAYTTSNFIRAVPFAIGVSVVTISMMHWSWRGVGLAIASGVFASGLGYSLWYAALKGLTATRAATVQLAVPILAAIAGILWLQEALSVRLMVASAMILGGIGIVVLGRHK
ncbi:MAG: DMT family transporter [Merismopedia sp. SIO2A8]|nr:DMT family transporter [Symploca sp. SIO2B6]NET49980.1 DMT family transporter [Merismopedia sp. SIO2A8]